MGVFISSTKKSTWRHSLIWGDAVRDYGSSGRRILQHDDRKKRGERGKSRGG
jgi:hypothetical protein